MILEFEKYPFTPILGWSISRYEVFDKCKRRYYYTYYSKHVSDVPKYKLDKLRALTSVPLEIGNVVHDVIEAFLRRLQISDSDIDEKRFFQFAQTKAKEYFSRKTFIETYYNYTKDIDVDFAVKRINLALSNFIQSPCYSWIYMKAVTNKTNWMIEPPGMGETRLNGLKAYSKMDFLFPVDDEVHILDWKSGGKDIAKHSMQLVGYAAAAASNFGIPCSKIYPRIIYLLPEFSEFSFDVNECGLNDFFSKVATQTEQMHTYCNDVENNVPLEIKAFPKSPSPSMCKYCNYQELCFPEGLYNEAEKF
ncbi:hypothetical protein CHISP_2123 [Chitinispirillum alkaliphilum]|nr:hypothetical protein CHISP_2123 [Chitinispirillum alkaliphilum]